MNSSAKKLCFVVATSLLLTTANTQCTTGPDCAMCTGNMCTACVNAGFEKVDPTGMFCNSCPGDFCAACSAD